MARIHEQLRQPRDLHDIQPGVPKGVQKTYADRHLTRGRRHRQELRHARLPQVTRTSVAAVTCSCIRSVHSQSLPVKYYYYNIVSLIFVLLLLLLNYYCLDIITTNTIIGITIIIETKSKNRQ